MVVVDLAAVVDFVAGEAAGLAVLGLGEAFEGVTEVLVGVLEDGAAFVCAIMPSARIGGFLT